MAKIRENKYLCDMDFTQSDQCFRNKYDVNINTSTVHDSRVMLLLSRGGHLSVYQDGNISTDLVRNFCLRTDCFRDLFTQRYSSFSAHSQYICGLTKLVIHNLETECSLEIIEISALGNTGN